MSGYLKDGVWHEGSGGFAGEDGRFARQDSVFRDWVTPDGEPGPDGQNAVPAEPGRYRLYVSYACPWAHRTLILRALKKLQDQIEVSVTHPLMLERGWTFDEGDGVIPDPMGHGTLHEIYQKSDPHVSGKATVPVLWDIKEERIVNNESADIIRMLTRSWDKFGAQRLDTYPEEHREEIDAVNERVYETVNNGVYKAGFAETQEAYEEAVLPLFESLRWLDGRLKTESYLVGNVLTEADVRLLTTLLRFDAIYPSHFKCNLCRIKDLPNLQEFLLNLASMPQIAGTIRMDHAKRHYYSSHRHINPSGIVPVGPVLEFEEAMP
jgi:putative glutathione S-transferase